MRIGKATEKKTQTRAGGAKSALNWKNKRGDTNDGNCNFNFITKANPREKAGNANKKRGQLGDNIDKTSAKPGCISRPLNFSERQRRNGKESTDGRKKRGGNCKLRDTGSESSWGLTRRANPLKKVLILFMGLGRELRLGRLQGKTVGQGGKGVKQMGFRRMILNRTGRHGRKRQKRSSLAHGGSRHQTEATKG